MHMFLYLKGKYESHTRVHTGEKPFQCDICFQRYSTKSNLTVHKKKHASDAPFPKKEHKCPFCSKLHATKRTLGKHVRRWDTDETQRPLFSMSMWRKVSLYQYFTLVFKVCSGFMLCTEQRLGVFQWHFPQNLLTLALNNVENPFTSSSVRLHLCGNIHVEFWQITVSNNF